MFFKCECSFIIWKNVFTHFVFLLYSYSYNVFRLRPIQTFRDLANKLDQATRLRS